MASHGYDWANVRNKPTAHSRSPSVEYPPNVGAEGFESDSDDEGVEGSCGIPSSGDLASPGASPGGPSVSNTAGVTLRSPGNHQRMDAYRFSLLNLEESLDADLDAILDDLTALGSQFERELKTVDAGSGADGNKTNASGAGTAGLPGAPHSRLPPASACQTLPGPDGNGHAVTTAGDCGRPTYRPHGLDLSHVRQDNSNEGGRTESPDADSAFSDSLSMLSSESSASSGGGSGAGGATTRGLNQTSPRQNASPTQEDVNRIKAEKIRLALEKIKEANVKKLFIKVFCGVGDSTKSLLVDERMTCAQVSRLLAEKSHLRMEPRLALVERLPHLMMERSFEDHEFLVENLMMWARDSPNTLHFVDRREKYGVFSCPERYLLGTSSSQKDETLDDEGRASLLEEFFGTGAGVVGGGAAVPEVEGHLYLKAEGKRAWKKHWFVLRASGLYFSPKGRSAKGSSKDLVCLARFEVNQVYYGFGWKKKYRAPTDFTFAIKNPQIQAKAPKHTRYLCAEDNASLQQWVAGIRIAKWGKQLWDNYRTLMEDITQEDIDILAQERACSVVSVPKQCQQQQQHQHQQQHLQSYQREGTLSPSTTPTPVKNKEDHHPSTPTLGAASATINRDDPIYASRRSSSSSSGCCSSSSTSGSTPTSSAASAATSAEGFECDIFAGPTGTIKRKPSMAPRLPLTATTRLLVKECGMDSVREPLSPSEESSSQQHTHNAGMPSIVNEAKRNIYGTGGTIRRGSDNRQPHPQPSQVMTAALASMSLRVASEVQERQLQLQAQRQLQQEQRDREQVDVLPLPPPPSEFELAAAHQEPDLPPPPPEAYQVPPTPVSVVAAANFNHHNHHQQRQQQQQQQQDQLQNHYQKLDHHHHPQQIYGTVEAGLPPPPSQQQLETAYSTAPQMQKQPVQQPVYQSPPPPLHKHLQQQPPQAAPPPPPPPPQGILRQSSQQFGSSTPPPPHQNGNLRLAMPPSPARKPKRITFSDEAAGGNNQAVPPREFLNDLRKVMEKKWHVAQKVKSGTIRNPYEVLGFRDYEPGTLVRDGEIDSYSHVSRWVLDHYGKPTLPGGQPVLLQQQQMQQPIYGTHQQVRQPPPVAPVVQHQPIYGTGQAVLRRPQSPSQPPMLRSQSLVQQHQHQHHHEQQQLQQQPIYGMHHAVSAPEPIYKQQRATSYHHGRNDDVQIYGVHQPQQQQLQHHSQVHQQPIYGQTNGLLHQHQQPQPQPQQQVYYQQPPQQQQQQQQQQIYGAPTAGISRVSSGPLMRQHSMGVADLNSLHRQQSYSMNDGLRSSQRKKPPPPPKRSDSTQLSAR